MPRGTTGESLIDRFEGEMFPDLYYSFYTQDEALRKKHMPNAAKVGDALRALKEWQRFTKKVVKIHFAIVPGLNDNIRDISNNIQRIKESKLRADFNIVKYNPYGYEGLPTEDASLQDAVEAALIRRFPESNVKVVNRVGYDVKASCGMFV